MEWMTQTEATDLRNYNIIALSGWTREVTFYSIKYLVFHRIKKREYKSSLFQLQPK